MPWRETCVMDERMRFVSAWLEGRQSVSELCRQYGVSRRTGHKWLLRYRSEGAAGLADRSRAPHSNARGLSGDVVAEVLSVRRRYPSWGPRKVKAFVEAEHPGLSWPAASTIGDLFDRTGLTRPRKRRRAAGPHPDALFQNHAGIGQRQQVLEVPADQEDGMATVAPTFVVDQFHDVNEQGSSHIDVWLQIQRKGPAAK